MSVGLDSFYAQVKIDNPELFEHIVAFASTFGQREEEIGMTTRYQVERYIMSLVAKVSR